MSDPIMLEIIQERLIAIVREMRANLTRTAYSSVIYEARDFSCVIMDAKGQLLAQAEDNPSHVFPIPWSVEAMLTNFGSDIEAGDIFLHNDPYSGGTHLNDVALIYPVFAQDRLFLFPVIRAHWGDVGGMTSGSLSGAACEIFQEGIRMPVLKVYRKGEPDRSLLDLLFANMRAPRERAGDFDAILGACRIAESRIRELLRKYGAAVITQYVEAALDLSEKRMRAAISRIPAGDYRYEAYLDGSAASLEPVRVKVRITVEEDRLTVDFSGSSPQTGGPLNAGPAVAPSGAFIIVKSLLDSEGAVNQGAFRPIRFVNPEGTVLNATYPTACGGFSEIRRCVEAAVMGALAPALPHRITGDIKGTANHVYISGMDPRTRAHFIFYEYPAGGTGAFSASDGNNAVRSFTEGDFSSIQPIEAIENLFPLLVERCELRTDSGGDGKMRGGLGLRRTVRVLCDGATLSVLSDKNRIPPFGVMGGFWGAPNRFSVYRDGNLIAPSAVPGKVSGFPLQRGDRVVMETSGGGGYGDPLERDIEKIRSDLLEGLITAAKAQDRYGVVLENGEIDLDQTGRRRAEIRGQRIHLRIAGRDGAEFEDTRRVCLLGSATVQKLGWRKGELVELVGHRGGPLRAWISARAEESEEIVVIDRSGQQILGLSDGDPVEIRRVDITVAATAQ